MALCVFVEPEAHISEALVFLQPLLCLFTLLSSPRPAGLLKHRPGRAFGGKRIGWSEEGKQ